MFGFIFAVLGLFTMCIVHILIFFYAIEGKHKQTQNRITLARALSMIYNLHGAFHEYVFDYIFQLVRFFISYINTGMMLLDKTK